MSNIKKRTPEMLSRSILERNNDTISVQKPDIAIKNLTSIIAAALKLSNKKGFEAMSLRDLSKEAGLSMGGLYAYFDSKTTLLNMILMQVTSAVHDVLTDPPETVRQDPLAHLDWLIEAHIRLTEDMLGWFTFAFMEAKSFPAKERQIAIDSEIMTEEIFAEVIGRAKAQGLLRSDVSPLLPSLIKPLLQDWYVKRAKYRKRKVSVSEYISTVQHFVRTACVDAADAPVSASP